MFEGNLHIIAILPRNCSGDGIGGTSPALACCEYRGGDGVYRTDPKTDSSSSVNFERPSLKEGKKKISSEGREKKPGRKGSCCSTQERRHSHAETAYTKRTLGGQY